MLIDWKKIPVAPGMRAGSDRQGICADKMSAVRVVTSPDAKFEGTTHWHDNEQILVMISGMVRLVVDGREFEAHPETSSFSLPAHVMPPSAWEARARCITRFLRRLVPISSRAGSASQSCGSTRRNAR